MPASRARHPGPRCGRHRGATRQGRAPWAPRRAGERGIAPAHPRRGGVACGAGRPTAQHARLAVAQLVGKLWRSGLPPHCRDAPHRAAPRHHGQGRWGRLGGEARGDGSSDRHPAPRPRRQGDRAAWFRHRRMVGSGRRRGAAGPGAARRTGRRRGGRGGDRAVRRTGGQDRPACRRRCQGHRGGCLGKPPRHPARQPRPARSRCHADRRRCAQFHGRGPVPGGAAGCAVLGDRRHPPAPRYPVVEIACRRGTARRVAGRASPVRGGDGGARRFAGLRRLFPRTGGRPGAHRSTVAG